ncbi:GNAT family N-acetyltransferase [Sphaerisporangium dianthi]|uniref:GNAT family N-acetyltransferase n=1 Tax=Sphaerisporangium dianthi TaxID=1436120 RepID=A0ABV9C8Z7_9ACTN
MVRRAVVADAGALTRLRALMLEAMGAPVGDQDAEWRKAAEAWFAERLADTGGFAAFVVDEPDSGVVCGAAGMCDRRAPGPSNLTGTQGHVFNISTDPRHRRRGHARACLEALLAWFRDETDAKVINLNATGDGADLYRAAGFVAPRFPALQLRIAELPPTSRP